MTLTCRDCGANFTFTASEQEFFAQKGFSNPSRCPSCREARKAERGESGGYSSGGYSRERQMYPAVCAQCGKDTQVPFEPRSERPVYCSECFEQRRPASSGSRGNDRGGYGNDRGGYGSGRGSYSGRGGY